MKYKTIQNELSASSHSFISSVKRWTCLLHREGRDLTTMEDVEAVKLRGHSQHDIGVEYILTNGTTIEVNLSENVMDAIERMREEFILYED